MISTPATGTLLPAYIRFVFYPTNNTGLHEKHIEGSKADDKLVFGVSKASWQ